MEVKKGQLESELGAIASQKEVPEDERVNRAGAVIDKLVSDPVRNLPALGDFCGIVVEKFGESSLLSKSILEKFIEKIDNINNEELKVIAEKGFNILRSKSSFFAKESFKLGFLLAEIYQADSDLYGAIKILSDIDVEKPQITLSEKLKVAVTGAEFGLAVNDSVTANKFLKRVQRLVEEKASAAPSGGALSAEESLGEPMLLLRYRLAYARVLDSQRRFIESSRRYMELSRVLPNEIDRKQSLEKAVTCAILAKAGTARSALLAALSRDPRSQDLPNCKMLEKMLDDKLIRSGEEEKFASLLTEEQNVEVELGVSVLQRAVREHNLLVTSRIYNNISLTDLGKLLNISPLAAEVMASKMIAERRLTAAIDQIDGFIDFTTESSSTLRQWEDEVQELCFSLIASLDQIAIKYPQYSF